MSSGHPYATRRFRQRPRQRRRLGRRTRGAQLAKRTHRAAWPYSRARGSAAAAASPRGPSDPPRGGSCSRRRRRGRGRCSGRRGGEGSGGGVGRRARAPQRGRRVALSACPPAAAPWAPPVADWRSGARDGRTGSGAFDAGRCVRHSDVAHRSVGCIREQPCTCCDCHWRRSGHMHRALVAAAAGRRQTASGPARGRAIFCTRESAADAFGAHAHARFGAHAHARGGVEDSRRAGQRPSSDGAVNALGLPDGIPILILICVGVYIYLYIYTHTRSVINLHINAKMYTDIYIYTYIYTTKTRLGV